MLRWLSLALLLTGVSSLTFHATNHWNGGFEMHITIPIDREMNGWTVHLKFSDDIYTLEQWVGILTPISQREWTITNKQYNGVAHVGETLTFSLLGHGAGNINPSVEVVFLGDGNGNPGSGQTEAPRQTTTSTKPPNTGGGTSSKDYGDALAKSILFYAAQRSGKLPADNPISWRGDSALSDCVVGGWYDAGDHVKFGLPFASTTHLLLWGLLRFKDGYQQAGLVDSMYDSVKWATDYMLKAWNPTTKELVVQIGDGNADHSFWGRPEDMTMSRPCLKIGPGKGGSDVAGETAASLAAGAIAFKEKGDTAYSNQLLTAAESLYAFAKANPGVYTQSVPTAGNFYLSSGYRDEMCLGGAWLYRLTRNVDYLTDAKNFYESAWGWSLSWDDKKVACQLLLYEETKENRYRDDVIGFFSGWVSGQVAHTPCGLAWRDTWGANRYAGNVAFGALLAAEAGIETARYRKWAVEQINYILGDNKVNGGCFSFQIGYGTKYPLNPHHRGASCPNKPAPCSDANLHSAGPSPQVLVGALVGGPDQQDNYQDDREDYVMNEVAIDYNAGFHSALAGIVHLQATSNFPPTQNRCPCNQ